MGGARPLLKSVARIGLSQISVWLLLLNQDPSHATRTMPFGFTNSTPVEKSFVRLSSGIGTSFALLNANDAPHGISPLFLVLANARLIPTSLFA